MLRQSAICVVLGLTAAATLASAQAPEAYAARLTWVPISLSEQSLVAGRGSATAMLSRSHLSITGTFEGLPTAASAVRLHQGVATGARGPAIADLELTGSTRGSFAGEVELDREQRTALRAGHLYIQVYADPGVPPDDAILRGWLLGQEAVSSGGRRRRER